MKKGRIDDDDDDDDGDFEDEAAAGRVRRGAGGGKGSSTRSGTKGVGAAGRDPSTDPKSTAPALVSERWRGAGFVASTFSTSGGVDFAAEGSSDGELGGADIRLPGGGPAVLILTESDYVGGCKDFKRRLARFYHGHQSSGLLKGPRPGGAGAPASHSVVVCARSELSGGDFFAVQTFATIELGLPLIPVSGDNLDVHLPQLLTQLSKAGSCGDDSGSGRRLKNPFKFGAATSGPGSSSGSTVQTLSKIPGVSEAKARLMQEAFPGGVYEVASAPKEELAKVVGLSTAEEVVRFFEARY